MTSDHDATEPVSRRELRARESQETTELQIRRRPQPTASQPTTVISGPGPEPAFRQERTVRPLPILLAAGGAAFALIAVLVVVGLAGASAPPVAATASPTPTTIAAAPPAPAPSVGPVVTPPRNDAGPNECADATGEGGSVDLESVSLSLEKGDLVAKFQLTSELPAGATSVGIYATSKDEKKAYQLAVDGKDGDVDRIFVHDFQTGRDTRLDSRDVEIDGTSITAAFPADVAKALGAGWQWYAFSAADGQTVDACPGNPLDFQMMTFETDPNGNN